MAQGKQRTCVVCRTTSTKNSFLRIVRSPEGEVFFDKTGKANGRGAYVCSMACLEKAVANKRFDSALRTKLSAEDYKRITDQAIEFVTDSKV